MGWNIRLIRIFMKRKLFILSFLFFPFNVYSNDSCILEAINEMLVNTLPNNTWILGRSSVLVEKNKDNDFYEWRNLQDNDLSTCWAEGKEDSGINEYFLIPFSRRDGVGFSYRKALRSKNIECHIKIYNGNCASIESFKENNRIKNCRIQIFDTPIVYGQEKSYVEANPLLIYDSLIEMKDTMELQEFDLPLKLRNDYVTSSPLLVLKITIADIYPGSDYDNTCISEINVYGEYVSDSVSN